MIFGHRPYSLKEQVVQRSWERGFPVKVITNVKALEQESGWCVSRETRQPLGQERNNRARRTRMIASEVREAGRVQITGLYRSRK